MIWGGLFLVVFVGLIAWASWKAGPRQADESAIRRGERLVRVTRDAPGDGWVPGDRTRTRGLDIRFEHDDAPSARAELRAPGFSGGPGAVRETTVRVRLSGDFERHHVHREGWVFQVSLRGTGQVVDRNVELKMVVALGDRPWAGYLELENRVNPAVGDWIEVEWAEIVRVEPG